MKVTRQKLIKLIKESVNDQSKHEFKYLNNDYTFKDKDFVLKKGLNKLTEELAMKYYNDDPSADHRGVIYITGQQPIGTAKRGAPVDMGKRIKYGEPVLVPAGINPETDKPKFRKIYPVVEDTQVNAMYSGDIYILTDEKRKYFLITQDPSIYRRVPIKTIIDIGVSVHSDFFGPNCQSMFRRGKYFLGKLDKHLTKIYSHAGLINDPPDYTNFLNSIIK